MIYYLTMLDSQYIDLIVRAALAEDIGSGDITAALIPPDKMIEGQITLNENAIICGQLFATKAFTQLDPSIHIHWQVTEGDHVPANTVVCKLQGLARTLLTGERTALNFLQTLSATATTTHYWVDKIKHTSTKLSDTRKTIPGLRLAQKYAVRVGGGTNHRKGLHDAFLIKENHIMACGSITKAVSQARSLHPKKFLEVEVENIDEYKEALTTGVHRIMLDGFTLNTIRQALAIPHPETLIEVSGIDSKDVVTLAELGVDYISLGLLTKNIHAIDYSMRFTV